VSALEGQLTEERRRVQAAEKKLKMVDVPLSETKDDTRLKQHEKEILVQEVSGFFTARNVRIASAVLATAIPSVRPSVCLSVYLSVTRR